MFLAPLAGEALRALRSHLLEATQTHSHRQMGPDPGLSVNINHHSGCGGPMDLSLDRPLDPSVLVSTSGKRACHICSEGRLLIRTRIDNHYIERSMKNRFDKWILKTASLD